MTVSWIRMGLLWHWHLTTASNNWHKFLVMQISYCVCMFIFSRTRRSIAYSLSIKKKILTIIKLYDKNISFLFFKGSRTRSQRSHFNTRLPGMCIYIYKICKLYDTHHHVPMYAKYEHIYRQTTLWNKYILYTYPLFNVVVGVYIYIFYKVDIKSEYIRLNDLKNKNDMFLSYNFIMVRIFFLSKGQVSSYS
jgi:hypothetical protein